LSVLNTVDPTDDGAYTCDITSAGGMLTSGPVNLNVLVPPVVDPLVWPSSIMVSEGVTQGNPLHVSALNDPATFIITGLPSGLTYNASTGEISGRGRRSFRC
jgi:hypothetical protein